MVDPGSDIRFALRSLRRTPGFTVTVLLTLTLGIGATTAMFSVMNAALVRSLPFPEPERLVLGRATFNGNVNNWGTSYLDYVDFRDRISTLESLAVTGIGAGLATITGEGHPVQAGMTAVSANLFATLGISPRWGRSFSREVLPEWGQGGEVVISHAFWQSWFSGAPDAVGRTLIVEGNPMTVVGIMPPGFRLMYDTDLWLPIWSGHDEPVARRYHQWLLIGRMRPDVSLASARSELDALALQLSDEYPETNGNKGLQLDGLHRFMVAGYRPSLFLLGGAIILVLLIACGNVAGLLIARVTARDPELAVRAALGAGRSRLVRQLFLECLLLALAAAISGCVLALWLQDLILGFLALDLLGIEGIGLSPAMLAITLLVSAGTVVIFGLFPSLRAARTDPAGHLRTGGRSVRAGKRIHPQSTLVVIQVAFSIILLTGSGLLLRSFFRLQAVDPGFRIENLLTGMVALPAGEYQDDNRRNEFFRNLQEQVASLPGVESVGLVNQLPILQTANNLHLWNPADPPATRGELPAVDRRIILPGYFRAMQIPLVEGRVFGRSDVADAPPVAILTRATAEMLFPGESALGHQVAAEMVGAEEPSFFEVVGVVEDHQLNSLSGWTGVAVFYPYAQHPARIMRLAVATTIDPALLRQPVQDLIREQDRNILLGDARPMRDALAGTIAGINSLTVILVVFAAVAVMLASLGLYGALTLFVTRRRYEIGIRIAVGATGSRVVRLVLIRGMILVGIGSVLGIAGALGITRLLAGMLYDISPNDPVTLIGVTVLLFVVATGAGLLPTRRAVNVDPMEVFRAG